MPNWNVNGIAWQHTHIHSQDGTIARAYWTKSSINSSFFFPFLSDGIKWWFFQSLLVVNKRINTQAHPQTYHNPKIKPLSDRRYANNGRSKTRIIIRTRLHWIENEYVDDSFNSKLSAFLWRCNLRCTQQEKYETFWKRKREKNISNTHTVSGNDDFIKLLYLNEGNKNQKYNRIGGRGKKQRKNTQADMRPSERPPMITRDLSERMRKEREIIQ